MKKILALLSLVLVVVSCSKDIDTSFELAANEGVAKFGVAFQANIADDQAVTVKIYKVVAGEEQLVRRYTSVADIPENLVLLYGDYVAKVQVGEKRVASFTERYFYGEQAFTIDEASKSTPVEVEVECNIVSTLVCVEYDSTVFEKLNDGFFTTVAVGDTYDAAAIASGDIHSLTYTETKNGFFVLPENYTSLVWHFEGTHPAEGKIVKEAVINDVKPAVKYTIRLKYSKDAPGGLVIEATVDDSIEVWEDVIIFSPDPTIVGVGFNLNDTQMAVAANHTYQVASMAKINNLSINIDGTAYDLLSGTTYDGITVVATDEMNYKVTLSEALFAKVAAGKKSVVFTVGDVDGGKLTKEVAYVVQGLVQMTTADYDFWYGNAKVSAIICNETSDVKIAYRVNGGEWNELAAKYNSDYTYTANMPLSGENTKFEYKLIVDGADYGTSYSITTPTGVQLPNGDFESWKDSKTPNGLWSSGNNSFTTLLKQSSDTHGGSYSANLVAMSAVGKFAAGNLFTGSFELNMSTMSGKVTFGKDFTYNIRPRSVTFWMKNNQGNITHGNKVSGKDPYSAMVLITDGTTYTVDTTNESSFLTADNLKDKPGMIAYGYLSDTDSNGEWVQKTIELTYVDNWQSMTPRKISVSFSTSAYGDYFCGSTDSWMYVDDIKLNY